MVKFTRVTLAVFVVMLSWTLLAPAQTSEPIRIGVVYPLSGSQALPVEGLVTGHKIAADMPCASAWSCGAISGFQ